MSPFLTAFLTVTAVVCFLGAFVSAMRWRQATPTERAWIAVAVVLGCFGSTICIQIMT